MNLGTAMGLKTLALFIGGVLCVLLVLGTLMGAAGWFVMRSCADRLHECYVARHYPNPLRVTRLRSLRQFDASASSIVFPVVIDEGERGVLVFDRGSGRSKLIQQDGFGLAWPRFSADGQHLSLIRYQRGGSSFEIISCLVGTWRCAVLMRTDYVLRSPVETEEGGIVYAASPRRVVDNQVRFSGWDFYYLKPGSDPVRITEFDFLDLYSVNVTKDSIIFSALDLKVNNPVLPKSSPVSPNSSKIYSVKFDPNAPQIVEPPGTIPPVFLLGGFSDTASMSSDGRWAAVHNTEEGRFKYRFDLVLVKEGGLIDRRIVLTGLGFSSGAFVGDTLVFNEMFEDRYNLRLLDLGTGSVRTISTIDHAPEKLRALEHIDLKIAG